MRTMLVWSCLGILVVAALLVGMGTARAQPGNLTMGSTGEGATSQAGPPPGT